MKAKTKRVGILLLSAGLITSVAVATGMILNGNSSLIANADNSKGMAVLTNAPRSTYWDKTQMSIPFTFNEGQTPQGNSLMSVDSFVKDYVVIDGVTASPNVGWYHMGNAPFNPADRSDYTLTFWTQNSDWLAEIKEVKLLAGFSWVTSDTQASFPTPGTGYYKVDGTELEKDVVLWNGGDNGWLDRAKAFTVTAEDAKMTLGGKFDVSQLKAKATLLDGSQVDINSEWLDVEFEPDGAGQKQATVRYQDLEAQQVTVTVEAAGKTLNGLEVTGADNLTARQYESPDLSGITVKAKYSDGTDTTLTPEQYTVTVDTWTKGAAEGKISYTELGTTQEADISVTVGDPDLTTGMEIEYDNGLPTLVPSTGMLQFKVTFTGVESFTQAVDIMSTDRLTGNHISNYVKITMDGTERTIAEWRQHSTRINVGVFNSGNFVIEVTNPGGAALHQNVQKITFLPGFQWVTTISNNSNWPSYDKADGEVDAIYRNVPNAVLKQEVTVWKGAADWERMASSIDAEYNGGSIAIGDEIDPSKVTVTAHYSDGTADRTIPVTSSMLSEISFEDSGEKTVTVTYQECTKEIQITVTGEALTGMEIIKDPAKLEYEVGDWTVDLNGIEVELIYTGGANGERREKLENASQKLTVGELDSYETAESKEITVSYQGLEAKFNVKIVPSTWGGITVDWQGGGGFVAKKQSPNLTIPVSIAGVSTNDTKAIVLWGDEDHVLDYIEINGKPAKDYLNNGLAWVGFYAQELTLTFSGTKLVWSTWADGTSDGSNDPNTHYVEGESEVVETVKLLKGFTWYSTSDGTDQWPAAPGTKFVKVNHAILNEDVMLYNDDGYGWMRVLKQDGGEVAKDAITVKSMPDKTAYKIGEKFDPEGFVLHFSYEDGGEEDITVIAADVKGFNSSTAGTKTLTVDYLDKGYYTISIEITVSADGAGGGTGNQPGGNPGGGTGDRPDGGSDGEASDGDEGGCGSVIPIGAGVFAALVMIGAVCIVCLRKHKE